MLDLRGRVALITGGTCGIGLATVRTLAEVGAAVVLTGGDEARAKEIAGSVPGTVEGRGLDVTDAHAVSALINSVAREYGRLDIVVTGATFPSTVSHPTADDVVTTEVAGTLHTIRAAACAMTGARCGSIVLLAPVAGECGTAAEAAVRAAWRAATANLSRTAAKEFGRYGIRVNAVAPGVIETGQPREFDGEFSGALARRGTVEEVAKVIRFLAGNEASFVTGQMLDVDGGLVL